MRESFETTILVLAVAVIFSLLGAAIVAGMVLAPGKMDALFVAPMVGWLVAYLVQTTIPHAVQSVNQALDTRRLRHERKQAQAGSTTLATDATGGEITEVVDG